MPRLGIENISMAANILQATNLCTVQGLQGAMSNHTLARKKEQIEPSFCTIPLPFQFSRRHKKEASRRA